MPNGERFGVDKFGEELVVWDCGSPQVVLQGERAGCRDCRHGERSDCQGPSWCYPESHEVYTCRETS